MGLDHFRLQKVGRRDAFWGLKGDALETRETSPVGFSASKFVGIWPMRIFLLSEMAAMVQSDRFVSLISRGAFGCMPTSSDWEIG